MQVFFVLEYCSLAEARLAHRHQHLGYQRFLSRIEYL